MVRGRLPILPLFVETVGCSPECVGCLPTAGWDRPVWTVFGPGQIEAALRNRRESGARMPVKLAFYGYGLLEQSAALQTDFVDEVMQGMRRGSVSGFRIALRPDQVMDSSFGQWAARLPVEVELAVPTLAPGTVERLGPAHNLTLVEQAVGLLKKSGIPWGAHTQPGLPGESFRASERSFLKILALEPAYLRITPVLVIRGTRLHEAFTAGRYTLRTLDEWIESLGRMMDMAEKSRVPVARLGWQPSDLRIRDDAVVAGPYHPSLRLLVESERAFAWVSGLLQLRVPPGRPARILVHPSRVEAVRGFQSLNIQRLRHRHRSRYLEVGGDPTLSQDALVLEFEGERHSLS